jgi:hypothetical protein
MLLGGLRLCPGTHAAELARALTSEHPCARLRLRLCLLTTKVPRARTSTFGCCGGKAKQLEAEAHDNEAWAALDDAIDALKVVHSEAEDIQLCGLAAVRELTPHLPSPWRKAIRASPRFREVLGSAADSGSIANLLALLATASTGSGTLAWPLATRLLNPTSVKLLIMGQAKAKASFIRLLAGTPPIDGPSTGDSAHHFDLACNGTQTSVFAPRTLGAVEYIDHADAIIVVASLAQHEARCKTAGHSASPRVADAMDLLQKLACSRRLSERLPVLVLTDFDVCEADLQAGTPVSEILAGHEGPSTTDSLIAHIEKVSEARCGRSTIVRQLNSINSSPTPSDVSQTMKLVGDVVDTVLHLQLTRALLDTGLGV